MLVAQPEEYPQRQWWQRAWSWVQGRWGVNSVQLSVAFQVGRLGQGQVVGSRPGAGWASRMAISGQVH